MEKQLEQRKDETLKGAVEGWDLLQPEDMKVEDDCDAQASMPTLPSTTSTGIESPTSMEAPADMDGSSMEVEPSRKRGASSSSDWQASTSCEGEQLCEHGWDRS